MADNGEDRIEETDGCKTVESRGTYKTVISCKSGKTSSTDMLQERKTTFIGMRGPLIMIKENDLVLKLTPGNRLQHSRMVLLLNNSILLKSPLPPPPPPH